MGTFNSTKFIPTARNDFRPVIERAREYYTANSYEFADNSGAISDGFSISQGGIFKAVLGMKTALNVELKPIAGGVNVSASVGIFGQQAVPTLLSMFVLWPVLVTQITGLVQQAKLDDEAIEFVEKTILQLDGNAAPGQTGAGAALSAGAGAASSAGAGAASSAGAGAASSAGAGAASSAGADAASSAGARFCGSCGAVLPPDAKFCTGCGTKIGG